MHYTFSYLEPLRHLIDIEFIADNISTSETSIQLPAWRPGRYELGNFAKNVKKFIATDENGKELSFRKSTKDCWRIETKGIRELHVKYSYYAIELNAGSTYVDDKQLYINPVNCCVYIPDRILEPCTVELKIPEDYNIATSLASADQSKKRNTPGYKHKMIAANYHELADSPFIASCTLKHTMFLLDGIEFNIWFQGECMPIWSKLVNDFFIFVNEQFVTMRATTPSAEYHFLFQALPYRFHHGVEHLSSTVIALGPSYDLMKRDTFLELLSVSSHELFHSWNIKSIRPIEMMPYDYTKENYSRLGFVCEGVTTYYGDFLLFRSGVYNEFEYIKSARRHLQAHFDNFGRYNLSVADSSFDTWIDGYIEIVPHRKTSIYSEGALIALMTDLLIRKYSSNQYSLDDVMRYLYEEFGKKAKGYSEKDYLLACEKMAGTSLQDFFETYVYKPTSYENALISCLEYIGLQLLNLPSKKFHERYLGFKVNESHLATKVTALYPSSAAERAGIQIGDEITSINGYSVKNNFTDWSGYFGSSKKEITKVKICLIVSNSGYIRTIVMTPSGEDYYRIYYIKKMLSPTEQQKDNFNAWSHRRY